MLNRSRVFTFLTEMKTIVFLIMCLSVHIGNAVAFYMLKLYPLAILNTVSSCFYILVLCISKNKSENLIVITYIEIILFSFISELLIGGYYGYLFFVFGMISVICYLLSSVKKHRHLLQGIGLIICVLLYVIERTHYSIIPWFTEQALPYSNYFKSINFGITLFTLIYSSTLYINDLNITKNQLSYSSNHDHLTGLYNRRFLEFIIERNQKETNSTYSVAMFDIDNFKKFNDTYGHETGDMVLELLSKCLSFPQEENCLAIRWGGEEFILYMPGTALDRAVEKARIVQQRLSEQFITVKQEKLSVTVTIGVAEGSNLSEFENTVNKADERLYYGKNHGKNCIISVSE